VTSADGARLVVAPCLPAAWSHCTLQYRYRATLYEIEVLQQDGDGERRELRLDGVLQAGDALPLVDDRHLHRVQLTLRTHAEAMGAPERRAQTFARLDGETQE
jgi:cellobiose phosphorylase